MSAAAGAKTLRSKIVKRLSKTGLPVAAAAAFVILCGFGLSCDPPALSTDLRVKIVQQPQGGTWVNTVTCVFAAGAFDSTVALGQPTRYANTLSWKWHSSGGGTYNPGTKAYSVNGETDTLSVSKSAPSGMYLDKKFWLVLTWTDAQGKHTLVSDTANCLVN